MQRPFRCRLRPPHMACVRRAAWTPLPKYVSCLSWTDDAASLSYINSCISYTWGTSFAAHGPPSGETNAQIGHFKVALRRARDALGYTNQRVLDPSGVSKTLICSQAHSPHQLPTICYTAGRELAVRVLRARPPGSFRGLPPTPGTLLQRVKRTRSSLRRH